MVDFYSRGLIGSDLFLTERGRIFAEMDQTDSIDFILQENDRKEGFRLYMEAAQSGALRTYEDKMGIAQDAGEFWGKQQRDFFLQFGN